LVAGGRASVRKVIRFNPPVCALYQSLTQAGRPGKLALTACMRKLLVILNAMSRDRRPWTGRGSSMWCQRQSLGRVMGQGRQPMARHGAFMMIILA
jgi:hypothetical protein